MAGTTSTCATVTCRCVLKIRPIWPSPVMVPRLGRSCPTTTSPLITSPPSRAVCAVTCRLPALLRRHIMIYAATLVNCCCRACALGVFVLSVKESSAALVSSAVAWREPIKGYPRPGDTNPRIGNMAEVSI
jgi:hypothetical protein